MTVRMSVDQTRDKQPVIRRDHGDIRRGLHARSPDLTNRVALDKNIDRLRALAQWIQHLPTPNYLEVSLRHIGGSTR